MLCNVAVVVQQYMKCRLSFARVCIARMSFVVQHAYLVPLCQQATCLRVDVDVVVDAAVRA